MGHVEIAALPCSIVLQSVRMPMHSHVTNSCLPWAATGVMPQATPMAELS